MTGYQQSVLWLGLLLIVLRLFSTGEWKNLWGTIGTAAAPASSSTSKKSAAPASGSNTAENLLKGYAGFLEHTGGFAA